MQIKPNSTRFDIKDDGQMLHWRDIKSDRASVEIKCEAIKDENSQISNIFYVSVIPGGFYH